MREGTENPSSEKFKTAVYDSEFFDFNERFDRFRELCAHSCNPLLVERDTEHHFRARLEVISLGEGIVGRGRVSPLSFYKTGRHVELSSARCIAGAFVVSGSLAVEQKHSSFIASPGELVLVDAFAPRSSKWAAAELFWFVIPDSELSLADRVWLYEALPWHGRPIAPLSTLLEFMAANMFVCSQTEVKSLHQALIPLLRITNGLTYPS
jgi:hypothetical protein